MASDKAGPSASDPLNDELRQLVQSLDDLDAEFHAGDLGAEDYRRLRADYTVRVAEAARRVGSTVDSPMDDPAAETEADDTAAEPSSPSSGKTSRLSRRKTRLAIIAAVLVVAAGAGWLVANFARDRGENDALTGSIDGSIDDRLAGCHDLAITAGQLLESLQCFDEVLADDPHNVEALTYRAWYLVLASGVEDIVTEEQEAELLASASDYLAQAVLVDPNYPDARAFRAVVAERQGRPDDVCTEISALLELDPPTFFVEQTAPLAERNDC